MRSLISAGRLSMETKAFRPKPWKLIVRWDHPGHDQGFTKTVSYETEEARKSREQSWIKAGWTIVEAVDPDA